METRAILRGVRLSAQKGRLVADMIRGKFADEALDILKYQPQRGARLLEKVLKSALGNAQDPEQSPGKTVRTEQLIVQDARVDGGPMFKHSEAFSFQVATDNQEETDRYWNAIVGNGGQESQCGWCKDRWGLSWQITPRVLTDAMAAGGDEAKRAFEAMMPMKKIDVATIEAARRG